jgi:hypothetical protein
VQINRPGGAAALLSRAVRLQGATVTVTAVSVIPPFAQILTIDPTLGSSRLEFEFGSLGIGARHLVRAAPRLVAVKGVEVLVERHQIGVDGKSSMNVLNCNYRTDAFSTFDGQLITAEMMQKPCSPYPVRAGESVASVGRRLHAERWPSFVASTMLLNGKEHAHRVRRIIYCPERQAQDAGGGATRSAAAFRKRAVRPVGGSTARGESVEEEAWLGAADDSLHRARYPGPAKHCHVELPADLEQPLRADTVVLFTRPTEFLKRTTFDGAVKLDDPVAASQQCGFCVLHARLRMTENLVFDIEAVRREPRRARARPASRVRARCARALNLAPVCPPLLPTPRSRFGTSSAPRRPRPRSSPPPPPSPRRSSRSTLGTRSR